MKKRGFLFFFVFLFCLPLLSTIATIIKKEKRGKERVWILAGGGSNCGDQGDDFIQKGTSKYPTRDKGRKKGESPISPQKKTGQKDGFKDREQYTNS